MTGCSTTRADAESCSSTPHVGPAASEVNRTLRAHECSLAFGIG